MFKGLTHRAQRILTLTSQEEARRLRSDQLFPEHIVLAILKDGEGVACSALVSLNINIIELRNSIERSCTAEKLSFVFGDLPLSRRARVLLDKAGEESRFWSHEYIGTEHLLYAAFKDSESAAAAFLAEKKITIEMYRSAVDLARDLRRKEPNQEQSSSSSSLPFKYFRDDRGEEEPLLPGSNALSAHAQLTGVPASGGGSSSANANPSPAPNTTTTPEKTPILDEYSRDLSAMAVLGLIDPVIGRQREINRVVRILARRTKNNPVLVGEPGVGKTAVVEGLALLLNTPEAPESLKGRRLITLDIASVVAGTKYRGEFEDRLKKIMKEINRAGNIILFIDELHTLIGAGGAEGTIDASNMLKPALSRGELQCIGATTLAEYRKHFERDSALERRFQLVLVEEPTEEASEEILRGIAPRYEAHHNVHFSDEAIHAAVSLAKRYVSGRFMPDKAIDLLDEAGAKRRLENECRPEELAIIEREIESLGEEKNRLVASQQYERAADIRDQVRRLRTRLEESRSEWLQSIQSETPTVELADVQHIVSEMTGIPLSRIEEGESRRMLNMEAELHTALIGQDEAVNVVSSAIRRSRAGISSPKRPLGSFIFLGPTGVGKTLLAKRLAAYLFGSEESLVRIDMSDYMEKHNASRLVGAPPGYIGYDEGGVLTEKIRRNPYRVILFDEIEKAHPDVFNLLLQVLEEGELKDNLGHVVSFRNTVLILTSNAGAREISRDGKPGFTAGTGLLSQSEIRSSAMNELKRLFNPEFVNRLDEIVVFQPLNKEQAAQVLDLLLLELNTRLNGKGLTVQLSSAAREILTEKGWDPKYGARPMRRAIQREIEDPIASLLLEHNCAEGTTFELDSNDGQLHIHMSSKAPKAPMQARKRQSKSSPQRTEPHNEKEPVSAGSNP